MKHFPKILIILFLTVFILQIICLFFLLAVPTASQAADPATFTPQVQIPGYTFDPKDQSTGNIANLVRAIYKYAIGIVGILAAVVLMIGGVLWIIAGGNATTIGEAKAWIGASLTGLLLALLSYLILATVNPALVDLKTTPIATVQQAKDDDKLIGCCTFKDQSGTIQTYYSRCEYKTRGECRIDKGFYEFFNNKQCTQVADCPQYGTASTLKQCSNKPDGLSCNVGDDPNIPGKCKSNECKQCLKQGASCTPVSYATFWQQIGAECCSGECSGLGQAGRCP